MAVHAPRTPKHVQKRTAWYTTRTLHSRYHTLLSLIALALHVMWYTGHYFVYRPVVLVDVRVYGPTQHARRTPRVYCTQQWSAGANERRTQGCRTHTRAEPCTDSPRIKNERSVCRRSVWAGPRLDAVFVCGSGFPEIYPGSPHFFILIVVKK